MLNSLTVKTGMSQSAPGTGGIGGTDTGSDHIDIGIYGDEKMATRAWVHDTGAEMKTRQGTGKHNAPGLTRKFGTEIRKQKRGGKATHRMPQRKFLGATPQDISKMGALIMEAIVNRLNRL